MTGNCAKCGTWRSCLHRDHIIPKWKGGPDTPDNIQDLCANCHQDKTCQDLKGRKVTEETKAKLRKATTAAWRRRADRHHTPEIRAKISAALKGVTKSIEHRNALSLALTGHKTNAGIPKSAKHRAALSASQKGRKQTPEHTAKVRAARWGIQ